MRHDVTSTLIIFMRPLLAAGSLLVEQEDIELLVLAAQPADEIAEQVGVDDPAEAIVPLAEPAALRPGQETELRGRPSFRRRPARLSVARAGLAEAAARAEAAGADATGALAPAAPPPRCRGGRRQTRESSGGGRRRRWTRCRARRRPPPPRAPTGTPDRRAPADTGSDGIPRSAGAPARGAASRPRRGGCRG